MNRCECCNQDATENYYSLGTCNDDGMGVVVCAYCIKGGDALVKERIVIRTKFLNEVENLQRRIKSDRSKLATDGNDDVVTRAASIKAHYRAITTLQNMFHELTGRFLEE